MNDRESWLAARRAGIGASDIAAVLGISPWKTPLQLYLGKRGELPPQEDAPQLRRGRLLEPVVLEFYTDETGHAVTRQQEHIIGAEPWMMATLDGFDVVSAGPVEAKTVNAFAARDFGEHGSDDVPLHYAAQVHWQMMLTACDRGYLAALIGGDDFRVFELRRDRDLEGMLIARAGEFWRRVQTGAPPEPICDLDVKLLYPSDAGASIVATPEMLQWCEAMSEAKQAEKNAASHVELNAFRLKAAMGEASTLLGPDGKPVATWKKAKDGQKTDWQAVATALHAAPDLVAEHTTTTAGSRRFLLKI